ncbi:surface-adhesin E family protein [Cupriavidus pauculus]|uniref:surface-adhesin E family protein n=1 Tax=Cupriavidus pauculus TaxID=82633 RepID=UPI0015DD942A|nr:surface-adhesin E family protein [Cupriavidus pauculus]
MNKIITALLAAGVLSAPLVVHAEWVPVSNDQSVLINNEQFVVNGDKRVAFVKFKGEKGDKYGSVIVRTTFDCTNLTTLDTYRALYNWKGKVVDSGSLYREPNPTIPGTLGAHMLKAVCSKSGGGVGNATDSGASAGSGGNDSPRYPNRTQTNLSTSIPNLSGYDNETRRTMELACISERSNGPVAYGACLNRQIASLQASPGIPNLSGYDNETRRTMELACISSRSNGPVAYGACLNRQITSLQGSPGIPNLRHPPQNRL